MSGTGNDVDAIQADVERTREELAETVDLLAAKLDVKARVRDQVTTADGRPTPAVLAVAGALAGLVALVVVLKIRRR
ncbi:DUF3618 domain-containing protein [Nocardioides sp. MAH-18]|uniref:DUF3618 domain-containing protein n=1 Tax=Nocardioides agri TaxID=2682843 RepID=A0A6L6XMP8_9ACTN|nr:DUF3618 domain-containing protein [Nocardioides sp. CGMCC 1.13656]MBA2953264.1 DUF3618 domain-containing protein [Nocardioides sp. CGMCC 1.13656]MVQ48132.1 DUF3618 domain-containing protein [Nocardioides sp. MAH-18]